MTTLHKPSMRTLVALAAVLLTTSCLDSGSADSGRTSILGSEYQDILRCIRCGACVVQCPVDALYLEDDAGERIPPDVIRRFKTNMLGKRTVVA